MVNVQSKKFALKPFLDAYIPSGTTQPANCVEVSSFLQLTLGAQGIDSDLHQLTAEDMFGELQLFITNMVCPVGSDASQSSTYLRLRFSMHQQCYVDGAVNDAALAYFENLSGGYHRNPAARWSMPGYWYTDYLGGRYGLFYRLWLFGSADSMQPHAVHPFDQVIPDPTYGPGTDAYTMSNAFDMVGFLPERP